MVFGETEGVLSVSPNEGGFGYGLHNNRQRAIIVS